MSYKKRLRNYSSQELKKMNYWLLLADPKAYGFDDLERDKKTAWDGISKSRAEAFTRIQERGHGPGLPHRSG